MKTIRQNQTAEWSFTSAKSRRDPFNELELSTCFEGEDGEKRLVPAFWAGGRIWRVRFSSPAPGWCPVWRAVGAGWPGVLDDFVGIPCNPVRSAGTRWRKQEARSDR